MNPSLIGSQFWGLGVGWFPVKHIRHGFSLVRREGGHINEQLYALILRGADDGAGICMPNEDDVALNPGQRLDPARPTSSLRLVSGIGAQTTPSPCFCKGRMISAQLAHSAQAP